VCSSDLVTRLNGFVTTADKYRMKVKSPMGPMDGECHMILVTTEMKEQFPWITAEVGDWLFELGEMEMTMVAGSLSAGPCKIEPGQDLFICGLKNLYLRTNALLSERTLLTDKTHGSDRFAGPGILVVNAGLDAMFNPEVYTERMWLIALWTLSLDMAGRSGKLNEFVQSPEYGEVVEIIERSGDLSELLRPANADLAAVRTTIGSELRDILIKTGAFKSNKATFNRAFDRLGGFIVGLSMAATGIEGLDELGKAKLMTGSIVAWLFMEEVVLPYVQASRLYQDNPPLKRAVDDYYFAFETYKAEAVNTVINQLTIDGGAMLAGLLAAPVLLKAGAAVGTAICPGLGTIAGAIAVVPGGLVIGYTADQLKQTGEATTYHDIASRLLTLARADGEPRTDRDIFCCATALHSGLDILKTKVIGRGLVYGLPSAIPLIETEEKRWAKFFADDARTFKNTEDKLNQIGRGLQPFTNTVLGCGVELEY
jgi:hypothetical protein